VARLAELHERHREQPDVQEVDETKAVHDIGRLTQLEEFVVVDLVLNAHVEAVGGDRENGLRVLEVALEAEELLELVHEGLLSDYGQVGVLAVLFVGGLQAGGEVGFVCGLE